MESEISIEQRNDFGSVFTETMMEQLMVYFVYTYFCGGKFMMDRHTGN